MIRYYKSENVLEEFYKNLSTRSDLRVHIPRSDVFYVRLALYERTGEWFTLDQVEKAMKDFE